MKTKLHFLFLVLALFIGIQPAHPATVQMGITPAGKNVLLSWPASLTNYVLQSATNLAPASWVTVSNVVPALVNNNCTVTVTNTNTLSARFFRLYNTNTPTVPAGMALIPADSFQMGDNFDGELDAPVHSIYVSAFYMDQTDVTYSLWQQVYNWATNHGYNFDYAGLGKAANYPVETIDWYDCVKWCNARSEMEGRTPAYYTSAAQTDVYRSNDIDITNSCVNWNAGYRLPTEAEWEKAARGGTNGQRFPWGNTISWSQANYYADPSDYHRYGSAYDLAPTTDFDPAFSDGDNYAECPFTSPVGYFAPNGYGLYDMAGNVSQWCWDWYGTYGSGSDPRGPTSGSDRVLRGGDWCDFASECRSAGRIYISPAGFEDSYFDYIMGFRSVLPSSQ